MSPPSTQTPRYVVICVDGDSDVLGALVRDVGEICRPVIEVEGCADADQVLALAQKLRPPDVRVPLVIAGDVTAGASGIDLLLALHEQHDYRATRKVLLSARTTREDVTRALSQGALHRSLSKPWVVEELRECIRSLLTSFFIHHAPEETDRVSDLIDSGQLPRAYRVAEQGRRALLLQIETLKRSFLAHTDMGDEEVERAMGAAIDEALNDPPRREYPAGAVLLRQDEPVDAVFILVSGEVQLSHRTGDREVVLDTCSGVMIIGLLALAHRRQAFFTCRAVTDITVVPLTLEQVDTALQTDPWLSGYLVTSLIRSMGRRSKRTAQLIAEVEDLNDKLRAERDQLADALRQLEKTQMRLVESEKMATLGQLSAGVAHELNNPVAAIQRAADFVREDLVALLGERPDGETIKACLVSALTREPVSTREQRRCRAALADAVGGDALAQRLVKVGVTNLDEYRAWFGWLSGKKLSRQLDAMERHCELGSSLRNITTCSQRIAAIVSSLRSYTRADQAAVADVNLHEGLEGTLLMFGHALREVAVEKAYGDLPTIECRVGEINQVWTNIISNALQAMNNKGTLRIETDAPDADHVRVRITDSGPGVSPEHANRVFDLNFTTKQGQASFGLGMGLTICHQIVTRHDGTIEMESEPGRTCMTVMLPVRHRPMPGQDGES